MRLMKYPDAQSIKINEVNITFGDMPKVLIDPDRKKQNRFYISKLKLKRDTLFLIDNWDGAILGSCNQNDMQELEILQQLKNTLNRKLIDP